MLIVTGTSVSHTPLIAAGLYGAFLVLASLALSGRNLRGLTCRHLLPERAYVGETTHISFHVHNPQRRLPAFSLAAIDDMMSQPQPRIITIQGIRPGHTSRATHEIVFPRRGVRRDVRVRIASDFPLGLARCRRSFILPDEIVVYPKPRRIPEVATLFGSGSGAENSRHHGLSGDVSGDFRAMREFRPGDPPKLISWPVSSRVGRLVVRELDRPAPRFVHVVFHNFQPPGALLSEASFENTLRILSGLFLDLQALGISFTFNAPSSGWTNLHVGTDRGTLTAALTSLATATVSTQPNLDALAEAILAAPAGVEAIVVVSNCPARHWAARIPHSGVPLLCMDNQGLLRNGEAAHATEAPAA